MITNCSTAVIRYRWIPVESKPLLGGYLEGKTVQWKQAFANHTSCIPLKWSTNVISPPKILSKLSLNSFSCSSVSFFVSSYSSSSKSALLKVTCFFMADHTNKVFWAFVKSLGRFEVLINCRHSTRRKKYSSLSISSPFFPIPSFLSFFFPCLPFFSPLFIPFLLFPLFFSPSWLHLPNFFVSPAHTRYI